MRVGRHYFAGQCRQIGVGEDRKPVICLAKKENKEVKVFWARVPPANKKVEYLALRPPPYRTE